MKIAQKSCNDCPWCVQRYSKRFHFLQKSYRNTTRLKFSNTIKKKSVPFTPRLNKSSEAPFQAISGDLLLGQTRAQWQPVGMSPTRFLATIIFSIFVIFFTTIFLTTIFFSIFFWGSFFYPPLFLFNFFCFFNPSFVFFSQSYLWLTVTVTVTGN